MLLHFINNSLRNRALVHGFAALCSDCFQYIGIGLVAQVEAYIAWVTIWLVKISGSGRVFFEMRIAFDQGIQARADFEATLSQGNRWLKELSPR